MSKIDTGMKQMYEGFTKKCSEQGRKISANEAVALVQRADELNQERTSSFSSEAHKGNKSLLKLLEKEKSHFSSEALDVIRKFTVHGQRPVGSGQGHGGTGATGGHHHGGGIFGDHHTHGGHGHHGGHGGGTPSTGGGTPSTGGGTPSSGGGWTGPSHPGDRPSTGGGVNAGGSSGGVTPPSGGTTGGNSGGGVSGPGAGGNAGGVSGPGAGGNAGGVTGPGSNTGSGAVGPYGREIFKFNANKQTWACHWFPMQETIPGGDPVNNLYAPKGPLAKLDLVTGRKSQNYEYQHNRKAVNEGAEFGWWGHCNNASEAACLLQAPRRSVRMKGVDGSMVEFSPGDIQGLLVKVTPHLVADRVDFEGKRYNSAGRDDPNDPRPDVFLNVIREWTTESIPFVMDIDNKEQVWNYPYDQVTVFESDTAPEGVQPVAGEGVKFYRFEMEGTGYGKKHRSYFGYVKADGDSGWIKLPDTHNNADFLWRPHPVGDLTQRSTWAARPGHGTNPEVDPQVVYDIYMESIRA